MAYRRTEKMETRLAQTRERIVHAALSLVARDGYGAAGMPAIAAEAGVSTGLLYRHFPSKADLFDEVFRHASQREIDACAAASAEGGSARERIARTAETFARRALKGRRLAWALLAEPVDSTVEAERVRFREPYRAIFADIIRDGIAAGEVAPQDARTMAAAIVGAIAESLIGPLSEQPHPQQEDALIATVVRFCVQSLGAEPSRSDQQRGEK